MEPKKDISFPLCGPTVPAEPLKLPGIFPKARSFLEEHGCTVTECGDGFVLVSYPEGTTSTEIYPRTCYVRYCILLPDGTELQESHPALSISSRLPNCLYLPETS